MSLVNERYDRIRLRNETLRYYAEHAEEFSKDTQLLEFSAMQSLFLRELPEHADILDFGCGAGRDVKAFLTAGHRVRAVDGCPELCWFASQFSGIPVECMTFEALSEISCYDGIWASASLLHLPWDALADVLIKIRCALRNGGILYASFKYGEFEGMRKGRYFMDMTESRFEALACRVPGLNVIRYLVTEDVRPGRVGERWLNLFMKRNVQ